MIELRYVWDCERIDKNLEYREVQDGKPITAWQQVPIVWQINPETASKHLAPYPKALSDRIVKYYSYVGDLVLDPFMGSGTTAVSCVDLKREYLGVEIHQEYIDMAQQRIASFGKIFRYHWLEAALPSLEQRDVPHEKKTRSFSEHTLWFQPKQEKRTRELRDRKSTRLNSSHSSVFRMPSSA